MLPSFHTIYRAIKAAPPRPAGFPLDVLLDAGRLRQLRAAPHLQPFLAKMREEAARASATPPPALTFSQFRMFEATGERYTYEEPYFDRRRRLLALALTVAVDGDDGPLPALEDLIWAICDEHSWALPAHLPLGHEAARATRPPRQVIDIFSSHTGHALAELLALLGERLSPWLRHRIRSEVEERILQPFASDVRPFHWEHTHSNWAGACAGSVGMTALAIEDDRERLAGIIGRVVQTLESFIEGFSEDGGFIEGVEGWGYGFAFYVYFADALARFTGGRLDLLQGEKIQQIADFPLAVALGNGTYINYADTPERARYHPGLGCYLARRFGQPLSGLPAPSFRYDHSYRWGHISRDLLWSEDAALGGQIGDGSYYLPDLSWVVERRMLQGRALAFSAKGGHNGEPHNHNDLGHFILHVGGESLLADLGPGIYTRQYFGGQRYEDIHASSYGHSVPLINGQPQQVGRRYDARVLHYERQPAGVRFVLDLTHAYASDELDSLIRSFDWQIDHEAQAATMVLRDSFRLSAPPTSLEECLISLRKPTLAEGTATWEGILGNVTLRFDPALLEPTVDPIPSFGLLGTPTTAYRLRLRALTDRADQVLDLRFRCALKTEP
ncbi:hypothetical protein F8S13_12590 [Chloroflexia bacterium SDU3-3]|nr:hypothetical protein F8S13_12590 [Chloroflexia bacterium SDU3-3]